MKKIKFLVSCFLLVTLFSCNDTNGDEAYGSDLKGTWKLIKSSGGIAGTVINYPEGSEVWVFDPATHSLSVTSTSNGPLATGNYSYSFENSDAPDLCSLTIFIDGVSFGCHSIENGVLSINQGYADGLNHEFVK